MRVMLKPGDTLEIGLDVKDSFSGPRTWAYVSLVDETDLTNTSRRKLQGTHVGSFRIRSAMGAGDLILRGQQNLEDVVGVSLHTADGKWPR